MPLTFDRRIPHPWTANAVNANFGADAEGFWLASGGRLLAASETGVREPARDITLENHGTGVVWGLTKSAEGQWLTMTRAGAGTGNIAVIRRFNRHSATDYRADRTFMVPAHITGINTAAMPWRAPKSLYTDNDGNIYCRVVRANLGNMRFVKFDNDGFGQTDDLTLPTSTPSSLADADSSANGHVYVVSRNDAKIFAFNLSNLSAISELDTDLESRNTMAYACAVHGDTLFVADRGGFIYAYTGANPPVRVASGGGGAPIGLFSVIVTDAIMSRRMDRLNRERGRR